MRYANQRLVIVGALSVATSICVAFEWFRELYFGTTGFRFLLWNLFLAWIPVVFALMIYAHYLRGRSPGRMLLPGLIWLLFLPNAPYLFTDFIHLSPTAGVPLWFDGTVLSAFAWTGALLCLVSVYFVHSAIRNWYGAFQGWMTVLVVLIFTSVGVYFGRFLRLNSWDVIVHPGRIVRQLTSSFNEPWTVIRGGTATVVVATMLAVTYVTFYAVISLRPASDHPGELEFGREFEVMEDNSAARTVHTKHGDLTLEQIADSLSGTGEVMASVSHCFGTAWHAGRAGKWELAAYYTRRVRGLMQTLAVRRPKYAAQLDEFLRDGLDPLLRAMVNRNEPEFRNRFVTCVEMANRFHVDTGHAYIEWTAPVTSPEQGLGLP